MRTIAITGATGGLAQEIVKRLSADDQLIVMGRSQQRLEKLYGVRPKTSCLQVDITDDHAIEQAVATIYQQFGQLDVFINNAGYGDFSAYDAYETSQIRQMFEVNTFATMTFSRLIGQHMAEQGHGHIINIASMAGLIASSKSSVYSASKFAVIGFSNALRLELAEKNVFVTTVNPGPIATHFFDTADPSGQYLKSVEKFTLQPEQVAEKIVANIGRSKRELNMPFTLATAHKLYTLFPTISDFLARKVFNYK